MWLDFNGLVGPFLAKLTLAPVSISLETQTERFPLLLAQEFLLSLIHI